MRFLKRSKTYVGSNLSFDPNKISAYSYGWWEFVRKIKGQIVFNDYNYSNATRRHQWTVSRLMRELGLDVDRTVKIQGGLQCISTLKELNAKENETLNCLEKELELKRIRRNEKARLRRQEKRNNERALARDAKSALGF